jgi:hypothetical protein
LTSQMAPWPWWGAPCLALESSVGVMYPTGHPIMAREPSVMSMFPIGHPNLTQDPSVMPHYQSFLPMTNKRVEITNHFALQTIT